MTPTLEKCTKLTENVPNGHKISPMSVKYYKWPLKISRPTEIYPNGDFWFENKPSGNPVRRSKNGQQLSTMQRIMFVKNF
jgi:hypothetical protein